MGVTKKLATLKTRQIIPYEKNPRLNDEAVEAVMKSIKQCEYIAPIIVDENNVILAGHTRYKALCEIGKKEIECLQVKGLSEEKKKKYRLLDNKTGELAEWDFDLLQEELEGIDFDDLELDWETMELDYMENLMDEGIEGSERTRAENFSVTFTFKNDYKETIQEYIKENGKEEMEKAIIKTAKEGKR